MRKLSPSTIGLIVLGALLLIGLIFLVTRAGDTDRDKLGDQVGSNAAPDDPEKKCASQATYDRIKRELFRRAAAVRGGDHAAYDKLVSYAVLRVETPILRGNDQKLNSVSCSAYISLDLPPGVAVAGGRRSLTAEIGYALQRAADGAGEVLTLTEADAIITPLATLARVGDDAAPDGAADNSVIAEPNVAEPGVNAPEPQPAPTPAPPRAEPARTTDPSFDCDDASTRGEIAVCREPALAQLDRTMAAQYRRGMASATPGQRTALVRTRNRFLAFRDSCQTVGCMRDAYVGRMQEIRDIMEGRWRPR